MKIIVLGKNSFVATHLPYEKVDDRLSPYDNSIMQMINTHKPDAIINCVAYCGVKNIDDCEVNKEKTVITNLVIPTLLAHECYKLGIQLIQPGSGCIFYGPSPNCVWDWEASDSERKYIPQFKDEGWRETDNPKLEHASLYSKIKYACDLAIGNLPNVCTLRLRMPISSRNHPRNLINKLLKYENVLEEPNSVTFLDDLVRVIDWVIEKNKSGTYHVTNPSPLTHPQLLEEYRRYHPKHNYKKINKEELSQFITAPRSNCILDCSKLANEGFIMTPTQTALENCIAQYVRGTL